MLSDGLLNKQIAYELGVSEATVKAHVSAILQKLGVESRTQAVIAAGKIEAGQWPQLPWRRAMALFRREPSTRHCAISARSVAGFSGLLSTCTPAARASSRTFGDRSAVTSTAGNSAPMRQRSSAIASMPLPSSR